MNMRTHGSRSRHASLCRRVTAIIFVLVEVTAIRTPDSQFRPGAMRQAIERKTCKAADGVQIVYSAAGGGQPALVFIHGGLANRDFRHGELKAFATRHRVIALDLPGHGDSGTNRQHWGIPQFGVDVRAVIEAEHIEKAILFGNSLGGPVAIEAALLIPEKILAVVGVDTFHSLTYKITPEEA